MINDTTPLNCFNLCSHKLVRLLNRLVASFHEEMAESIELLEDVPQFLDESDFN